MTEKNTGGINASNRHAVTTSKVMMSFGKEENVPYEFAALSDDDSQMQRGRLILGEVKSEEDNATKEGPASSKPNFNIE
jgi:hypothetical protein